MSRPRNDFARSAGLLLLALGFIGLALPGSAEAQSVAHQVVMTVNVETGGISFSLDPVRAYPGDRVRFSAPGSEEFCVVFQGETPFAGREICGSGQQPRNVPILPDAALGSYKYDAHVTVNGVEYVVDPEIVVRGRGDVEDTRR